MQVVTRSNMQLHSNNEKMKHEHNFAKRYIKERTMCDQLNVTGSHNTNICSLYFAFVLSFALIRRETHRCGTIGLY